MGYCPPSSAVEQSQAQRPHVNLAMEILVALYDSDRGGECHNPFFLLFISFFRENKLNYQCSS